MDMSMRLEYNGKNALQYRLAFLQRRVDARDEGRHRDRGVHANRIRILRFPSESHSLSVPVSNFTACLARWVGKQCADQKTNRNISISG